MGQPRSVAGLLVRWAIRADRVKDLRDRVEERLKQPTAEAAAKSIPVLLDLARQDYPAANQGLEAAREPAPRRTSSSRPPS